MSKPTILIVEDDGILAIHLQDLLTRQGYEVLKPIPTGEKAILAVKKHNPDLVLMDIELGGELNGISTAEQLATTTDIPVIFLTGFSQDPLLQQAKIATPYGYLVKPVPERELAATIEMALYKHKIDHQIKVSEAKYRSLIEQATDGIFMVDKDGNFTEVNSAGCNMLGYTREEMLLKNMRGIISPENLVVTPLHTKEMQVDSVLRTERILIRKDGSLFPVEISGKMLGNRSIQGIVRDITERKEAEHKNKLNEIRLRSLLEISQLRVKNTQELLEFALEKAIQLTESEIGYIHFYNELTKEFKLITWSQKLIPDNDIIEKQNIIELEKTNFWGESIRQRHAIMDNDFHTLYPPKIDLPEGRLLLTKFLTIPVLVNQSIVAVVGVANKVLDYDATDELQLSLMMDSIWKIVEQTNADEKLRLVSAALNATVNAIVITGVDGIIEWANPAFNTLTGYSLDEAEGKNPRDLVKSGQHSKGFYQQMWTTILAGQVWQGEIVNRRKDGTLYNEEMTITPMLDTYGEIKQFIAIKQDISERKFAEEQLKTLAKFPEENPNPVLRISKEGLVQYANGSSNRLLSYWNTHEGEYLPDEWKFRIVEVFNSQTNYEINLTCGQVIYSCMFVPILGEEYVNVYGRDISEREEMEQKLRYSEERYRLLFEEMAEGFALHETILDENGKPIDYRFLDINPAFEKQTGLKKKDIIGRTVKEVLTQTEDYWIQSYGQVALTGKILHYENYSEALGKWFNVTAFSPKIGQFAVTFEDITESHKMNVALHANEHLLNQIFEILPAGLWIANCKGEIIRSNPAGRKIWGLEPLVGQNENGIFQAWRLPTKEVIAQDDWALAHTINEGVTILNEMLEIDTFDNQKKIILNSTAPVKNEKGQVEAAVIVNLDITDWVRAEEALKRSLIHFQSLIENAPDGIALIGQDGHFMYVSPSGRKNFGYELDEEIDISPNKVTHPDDLPAVFDLLNKLMQNPAERLSLKYRFRHKDGSYRWIESTFSNLLHEPSVEAIVINFRDITPRREAEIKIQEQLDELRRWHENTVGREMRLLELKEEVNQALKQAGLPPRYNSTYQMEQTNE